MHALVITGSLALLVGVPYLLVFLYDLSRGEATLIAGAVSVLPAVIGAALLYSGLRAVRTAEQGLAEWRRVSGQIVSVERRAKSSSWELRVRWTEPVTGRARELTGIGVDVHPRYLIPDGKIPVAVNPDDPDRSQVDASKLLSVPDSKLPPFPPGAWLRAYATGAAISMRSSETWIFVLLALWPLAFLGFGVREIALDVARSETVPMSAYISPVVGVAGLALLLWLCRPKATILGNHLQANGVRSEARILGFQTTKDGHRQVVLEWPGGRARLEYLDHTPAQPTLPVWRDPRDPRVYWVDTRETAKP
jgi:hypothetical protein